LPRLGADKRGIKRTLRHNAGAQRFAAWSEVALERLLELPETCALDVADRGAHALHEVGDTLSMTREGARLIESIGLAELRQHGVDLGVVDESEDALPAPAPGQMPVITETCDPKN
jgi:hypothetical protein